ncbi:hypothetical protein GGTG_13922 [Gaeumannomyces tritici R3-111a-1]|uniref:Uncharacterized protein n=1 Tax=Gaeumannomyces tritici (strain R3-111a-1) TaxID=644352 RepID=J3PK73_GAET3|nr:hypothetical protein GGTG_13922 [Gaeumannomyces tritici R3-111a-1]EJT68504.1 hypothetical protein GGTG_13922 [Gaeumannomyces tritici R3-111a-1]
MPYLIECNEWRLLQTLGPLINQRKSRFNVHLLNSLDSRPETHDARLPNLAAERFEVEVRLVFLLPKDCSRALSTTEFDECEERLKGVCELLDRIVHPRHGVSQIHAAENKAGYSRLRSLVRLLEHSESDETVDLASGSRPTLFKPPDDPVDLEISLALVADYNNSLARLFASPAREGRVRPVSKKIGRKTWKDPRLRRRATSALGAIFERLKCGIGHEVMLNVSEDADDGAAVPSLDFRLSSSQPSSAPPKENLDKLISSGAFKPLDLLTLTRGSLPIRYSIREKRALAVRLGYCLMDFFDANLSSKRIYFLGSTKASCSRTRSETLYLSFASGLPATTESHVFQIGHPTLLSFAKLLLEIDFGQSIDLNISSDDDKTNRGIWAELCNVVDKLEEERNDSYLQAVRGCLMAHIQISRALRLGSADEKDAELTIRKELYREVVEKLETALAESTPRAGNKRQRSESPEPTSRTKPRLGIRDEWREPSIDASDVRANALSRQAPIRPASKRPRMPNTPETESIRPSRLGLSSSGLLPGSTESNPRWQPEREALFHSAIVPKMWLSELMKISRQVESKRREWRIATPVRVAILDTGLDWDFPVFQERSGLLKSVTDVKDFVTPSTPTVTDVFGHGTFMARLIMECAPGVEILVARVAENTNELKNSQANIKEAILWAGQAGKADIISMSFGFPSDDQGIREAIETVQKGRNENIIFLASAGNSSTEDESFPARHPSVISVYATNCHGVFLQSNSASTGNGAAVLGTYGDDIPAAIREEFRTTYPKVCEPGSSVATAIMAGISATMLAYASVLPSLVPFQGVTVLQRLWTTKGMEAVLYRLAPEDRDRPRLRAVKPMWFWKNRPGDPMRYCAICDALSDIDRRFPRLRGTG